MKKRFTVSDLVKRFDEDEEIELRYINSLCRCGRDYHETKYGTLKELVNKFNLQNDTLELLHDDVFRYYNKGYKLRVSTSLCSRCYNINILSDIIKNGSIVVANVEVTVDELIDAYYNIRLKKEGIL